MKISIMLVYNKPVVCKESKGYENEIYNVLSGDTLNDK